MALFSRRRSDHLRAVDLAQVPDTGPPAVVHQTHGEAIGARVDTLVRARNQVVICQGELAKAEDAWRAAEIDLIESVKALGIRPETIDGLMRREG